MTPPTHVPVLLEETLELLAVKPDGLYVDATFGRGGHAAAILDRLGSSGKLYAFDRDPDAIAEAQRQAANDARLVPVHAPFAQLRDGLANCGVASGQVNGIVFDLGVSSPQLDTASRGFSFMRDGPLDMRMNPDDEPGAADWIADVTPKELTQVIRRLGEEKFATRIARAIVARRETAPIQTTHDLATIVDQARPIKEPGRHPATRTFQAIRMHINDELGQLERALPQAVDALTVGGRLVVIAFHSLEDRIVKRYFADTAKGDPFPPDFPVRANELSPAVRHVGRLVRPDNAQIEANPRARSSRLRCVEKLEGTACAQ